jgi:hypothetical protein
MVAKAIADTVRRNISLAITLRRRAGVSARRVRKKRAKGLGARAKAYRPRQG